MPACNFKTVGLIGALAVAMVGPSACGDDQVNDELLNGNVVLTDRTLQTLKVADISYLVGTYTNCKRQTGSWSLANPPVVDPPPFPPLQVVAGDASCVLTLTGVYVTNSQSLYEAASPGIPLNDAVSGSAARAFGPQGGPVAFYANASLSDSLPTGQNPGADLSGFTKEFTVQLVVSDDLASAQNATIPAVSISSATLSGSVVAAPQYDLDDNSLAGVLLTAANNRVVSIDGNIAFTLTDVNRAAQFYRVVDGNFSAGGFGEVDAKYRDTNSSDDNAYPIGPPGTFEVPSQLLLQPNESLADGHPVSVIIARTEGIPAVTSYQVVTLSFSAPAINDGCELGLVGLLGQCIIAP
jgi:hypothetical protein